MNAAALSVLIKTTTGTIANLGFIVKPDNQCKFRIASADPDTKHKYEWDLDTTLVPCLYNDFPVVDHVQTESQIIYGSSRSSNQSDESRKIYFWMAESVEFGSSTLP